MAGGKPRILIVVDNRHERAAIDTVLREAGFAVIALAEHRAPCPGMPRDAFAAAVVAVTAGPDSAVLRGVRARQPDLKALIVGDPAALPLVDRGGDALLARPFDPRRLLHALFELVLREDLEWGALDQADAAERGIAAARLACFGKSVGAA